MKRKKKKSNWEAQWESMTVDELFELRELMQDVLMERLKAKKAEIERKLQELGHPRSNVEPSKPHSPKLDQ